MIVARTVKGKGVAAVEDQPGHHGKPVADADAAIAELGGDSEMILQTASTTDARPHRFAPSSDHSAIAGPRYEVGSREATRKAFGAAVAALGSHDPRVVVLDGEVDNSTGAASFAERHPDRYFEMFIAEQQMIAAAVGMQVRGWRPIATSFAAFFSRAYDFVRMASISRATMALVGSHDGVSIGADGPSQMALEDIASLRAIHGSTVLHPSDATQTVALTAGLADRDGITFLRTLRGETTVRTRPEETVRVGGSRVAAGDSSRNGDVAIIGCGATIDEAVAAERLAEDGYRAQVLDCYSIKPINREAISNVALRCRNIITVEDHRPEGGLGDAVLGALADSDALTDIRVRKLAVRELPISGAPDELRRAAGIDTDAIVRTARELLASAPDAVANSG